MEVCQQERLEKLQACALQGKGLSNGGWRTCWMPVLVSVVSAESAPGEPGVLVERVPEEGRMSSPQLRRSWSKVVQAERRPANA